MSMVVDLCMGELTKLTDKIWLKKKHQKLPNFFLKSQTARNEADEQKDESGLTLTESEKPASVLLKSPATEYELSEETVFWLMDRFAPC